MKRKKAALWIAVCLISVTGCGGQKEQLVETEGIVTPVQDDDSFEEDENKEEAENNTSENDENSAEGNGENNAEGNDENNASGNDENDVGGGDENESGSSGESQAEDSFEGVVKEINEKDNFVVVSKIFTEEYEGGGETAVIMVGEGSGGEELITVYFTENTDFQIKTVKNAGEEVTEKEGAFSDIRKESILELKGKMDAKGEEFLADEVFINEFIYS